MKKLWPLLLGVLWMPIGLVMAQGCSTLILSGPPSAAPSSWLSEGKLIGAAVEYSTKVGLAAGVKSVEVRGFATWRDTLAAAYRGEVDAIFSTNYSEERERYLDYVRPAMSSQFLNVVVRRGEAFVFDKLEKLVPLKGANPEGETYGDGYFGSFVQQHLKLEKESNVAKVVDLLLDKKVDYILIFENAMYEQMMVRNLGSKLQILNTYPTRAEGFVAFSKRSKCSSEVREKFAEQVFLANSQHQYIALLKKYREIFNESLTRPQ